MSSKSLPTAAFYTLGCRLNQTESSIMAKSLEDIGYRVIEDEKSADLCVINTCTVTNQSDAKCRKRIRSIQRQNPGAIIAVVGCFTQVSSQQIADMGGVGIILGNEEKLNLAEFVIEYSNTGKAIVKVPPLSKQPFRIETVGQRLDSTRANLKIQDGCDFICSYCIIPTARGRSRPRIPESIAEEARALVDQGVKEIILTGVNIGTYQYENLGFLDIVDLLEKIEGIHRIRISSIEPTTIGTELFAKMKDPSGKLTPHLHLPLQSGSDEILSKMRRKYGLDEFARFVRQAAEEIPELCIGTDVMVGFPGETDAMFEETVQALTRLPIAYFHVFPFAVRKGTTAEKLSDKNSGDTISRRASLLRALSERKKRRFLERFEGKKVEVLFESQKPAGNWSGYSGNYIRVTVKSEENLKNQIRDVKVLSVDDGFVWGEIA